MLTLHLHSADLNQRWHVEDSCLRSGRSYIAPFLHPSVIPAAFDEPERFTLILVEGQTSAARALHIEDCSPGARNDAMRSMQECARDTLVVEIDRTQRSIQIATGAWGTAPIYLAADNSSLLGHWDFRALSHKLPMRELDVELAAHYLHGSLPYSSRTMLRGVVRLTERAVVCWGNGTLTVGYPPPAADLHPRSLRPGADVVGSYRKALASAIRQGTGGSAWGLELSGGVDSASLAIAATSDGFERLRTFGLEIEGPAAGQQRARRAEIVALTGAKDFTTRASDAPPLSDVREGNWLGPLAEIYAAAFDRLAARAAESGVQSMVTGVGGDELLLPHFSEREEERSRPQEARASAFITPLARSLYESTRDGIGHAPRTLVPRSTLFSLGARVPLFLRRGLWPVSPFAHPDVVAMCRSLPAEWRRDKHLHRALLAASGCSPEVVRPAMRENFHQVLLDSLRVHQRELLKELFARPLLATTGLIDAERLARDYERFAETGELSGEERFYEAAVLELLLLRA